MNRDQAIGWAVLAASVAVIIVYGWLLYAFPMLVLQVTAFIAVAAILGVLAWIGWIMATTPPPTPIEGEAATGREESATTGPRKEEA